MWSKKWNAQFEWFVQASLAKRDGLQPEVIEAIRVGQKPKFTKSDEQLVFNALTELFSNNAISDATFTSLHNTLGYAATADFINFSGIFNMAGMVINMLDMKAPAPFPADPVLH
jgi:4-carboxymuconolactone decarboxylase